MRAVYWDASAIVSAAVRDTFTYRAREALRGKDVHLISTLALAEVDAVISRLARMGLVTHRQVDRVARYTRGGTWRILWSHPSPADLLRLSAAHPLRGADLWHLANALGLTGDLPDLCLLTFDERLATAARAEGLGI
jgi:predicted nucleic acid-binding protein